jgi:hypothetical protein
MQHGQTTFSQKENSLSAALKHKNFKIAPLIMKFTCFLWEFSLR